MPLANFECRHGCLLTGHSIGVGILVVLRTLGSKFKRFVFCHHNPTVQNVIHFLLFVSVRAFIINRHMLISPVKPRTGPVAR